jgi:predicted metallo-beta-lactamase superfamily hydrolase
MVILLFDYECEITIKINNKHEKRMEELKSKLGRCENDKFQSVDGKYFYLAPNTLISWKKPIFVGFDVRN